jgi:hypothetical protein
MLHKNQHVINTDNEHILHGLLDGVCVCLFQDFSTFKAHSDDTTHSVLNTPRAGT